MAKRKRASARSRRVGRKGAADAASRLPHHPRYTAALLEQIRQRFEATPEPIPSMAADLGVAPGSLHRIARRHGWVRRSPVPPARDVSPVLRILAEAQALEAGDAATRVEEVSKAEPRVTLPPRSGGEGRPLKAVGVGGADEPSEAPPTPNPSPPLAALAGGGERAEFAAAAVESQHAAEPPGLSTIERLERAVLAELATIEAMRAAMGTMPQKPVGAARTVRTLSMLTQTLQHLQRLRASAALAEKPIARNEYDDDDMPADIDEFRRDLARRIDAFVASRTEQRDAGGGAAAPAVDQAR
jgi:hypothetical protein